ncbi:voltage-gated potassium channel [Prosthecobacter fusiformis]|uniref:Voltage-gated potassium channel n=1 Tax=Prosthecobacter fusiformis TaxID=48464 RepID=A0A4V3FI64_9BACT|nr:ion transporter [Prosthecobacter fusiformis]TDU81213.1 voltage-gated potassium channel [Prosthecobacter fusiformis]
MNKSRLRFLDALVLLLSIYVIVALMIQLTVPLEENVRELMNYLDVFVCTVFFSDFVIRFCKAESKIAFMRWGWIDLLSCIPANVFTLGRAVRIFQIVRILRAFRSMRAIMSYLHQHRARSMAATTVLMAVVLLLFSMISILIFENEEGSNIRSPLDALWWGITTMTTVGYGDHYPVTVGGRFVAMLLMITGVGLFGVLTGLFARFFVEPELKRDDGDMRELVNEVRMLRERLESIEKRFTDTQTP